MDSSIGGGTKIHVIVDGGSKPIAVAISPGNTHDSQIFNNLYDKMERKPERIYGDSAYDEVRDRLGRGGVEANMPVNPGNMGRQIPCGEEGYGVMRPIIEGFNAWLKTFRRAVARYEGLAAIFQAIATLACMIIHMGHRL